MTTLRCEQSNVLPKEVLLAVSLGFRLLPVRSGDKIPLIKEWQKAATCQLGAIEEWATLHFGCNWAVATGRESGIFVLDIDGENGSKALSALQEEYRELPQTLGVSTGRGRHMYFRWPEDMTIRNSASRLGDGLDVRGEGGYVVIPPSIHSSGRLYVYDDADVSIANAPDWLLDRLKVSVSSLVPVANFPENEISKGKRNATLTSLAGTMRVKGMTQCAIEAALLEENQQRCQPPLPKEEVCRIAASITRYPPGRVISASETPTEWPDPESLKDTLPDVVPFDLELMPASLRPLVQDVAERMQTPLDFPAVAVIVTLAGLTNRRAMIQPKRKDTSWTEVPNIWGGIVARPGTLKSPVISSVTKPARAIEREWREAYQEEEKDYQEKLELYNLEVKTWEAQYRAAVRKNKERPAKPKSTLERPVLRRLITSDATFESLHEVLSANPAGLFVLRDELTGWLAGLERQGREQERAFYLECWNGNAPFTIDRIGRGSVHVTDCCISLFGGIQPARLRAYLADALRDGPSNDGLIQRFQLLVWPDLSPKSVYIDREPDSDALKQADLVFRRMAALSPASPLRLQFDDEAQEEFEQWLIDLDLRVRSEELLPAMQAHLAKYRGLMPSLALLFALADGHTESVPLEHARMAREWCAYLETHAIRVYASQARPEYQAAITLSRRLAKGWKCTEGVFSLRDVYRSGWSGLDQPDTARAALQVLEDYSWVRRGRTGEVQTSGRPSEAYIRNPRIEAKHNREQAIAELDAA